VLPSGAGATKVVYAEIFWVHQYYWLWVQG
jgi:hypothetical protein